MQLLGVRRHGQTFARAFDGRRSLVSVYYVRMRVEGFDVPTLVRCYGTARNDVLLGRNVLNHFIVTLDGKRLAFEIVDP